jgi:hypothetical protein
MSRRVILILVAAVAGLALLAWLLLSARPPRPRSGAAVSGPVAPTPSPAPEQRIVLLFAGFDGLLHPELRTVSVPVELGGRVRVVVRELLAGAQGGFNAVVPYPAELLGVFVDGDGNAYVDLSAPPEPLTGSNTELLLAYGVVDSVLLNCPELHAVQLLFAGEEVDTLSGHLDLSRPLPLNRSFIAP